MLEKSVNYLEKHRLQNIVLVIIYTIAIVFLHDYMVHKSIIVMNTLGLQYYNTIVAIGSALFGLFLIAFVGYMLYKNRDEELKKIFYLIGTLLLMLLHFNTMFEMNIEIIHSLQFGVLGFLLFPFSRKIGATVVLSLPIMLLDEWHQYQVLYPGYVEYFEFNDIVMNIFGLSLLCILLWISGVKHNKSTSPIYIRWEFKLLLVYIAIIAILILTNIIVFYPEEQKEHTFLILNQLEQRDAFWIIHKFSGAKYHVLSPIESFVIISSLSIFYMFADFKLKASVTK